MYNIFKVGSQINKWEKKLQDTLQSKNLSKNRTHFMQRTSKCQITLQLYQNKKIQQKNPFNFFKKNFKSIKKQWGTLEKWKSLKILLNSKLSNLILHLKPIIKVKGDSWFFGLINKQFFKIGNDIKRVGTSNWFWPKININLKSVLT